LQRHSRHILATRFEFVRPACTGGETFRKGKIVAPPIAWATVPSSSVAMSSNRGFALIHSPLLGPRSWQAVGDALDSRGERTFLIDLSEGLGVQRGFYAALGETACRQIGGCSFLVAHSGAGALIPSILQAAGGRVHAAIFVDALLPHPGRSWFDTAPAALVSRLRREARAGRAPPWPNWLPPERLAHLLPDRAMRQNLIDEAPAAPLAFLDEPAPDCPAIARPHGCAYLQLSSAYDREADQARARGWPTNRLDGHHLSAMTQPSLVADAIDDLASRLRP
jgi:hypothetical protein